MTTHWHKRAVAALHQVEEYVLRDFGERDTRREPKNQARQTTDDNK